MKIVEVTAVSSTVKAFLLPLIEELCNMGNELFIITSDPDGSLNDHFKNTSQNVEVVNVDIPRSLSPLKLLKAYSDIKKSLKRINPDILHTHTPVASAISRVAAKKTGVRKIIYTAHGFYFHENMGKLKYKLFFSLEKFLAKRYTDLIFTVNEEDRKTAINNGFIPAEKIVNTNSVGIDTKCKFNPERFSESFKKSLKENLKIKDNETVFTFVGRLVEEKGVFELIEAFSEASKKEVNTKLLIIGETLKTDRDSGVKEKLMQIVMKNDIEDKVLFLGHRDDIPELLSITDIFVLPSYREGMPVSPLEAMSMGVPVIGTDIRGMREEITEGKNGYLVPVKDFQKLANAMNKIIHENIKMKEFCRKNTIENFDMKKVIDLQIDFFRKRK